MGRLFVSQICRIEFSGLEAVAVLHQYLDTPLGIGEPRAAFAREFNSLFKKLETFFQRQIAALEPLHNFLKLRKRNFKRLFHTIRVV